MFGFLWGVFEKISSLFMIYLLIGYFFMGRSANESFSDAQKIATQAKSYIEKSI